MSPRNLSGVNLVLKTRWKWRFLCWAWILIWLCGCQPYPDHAEPIYDFRADFVDFGVRRELAIARYQGDRESLLIEFNQPLQHLDDEGKDAPFQLRFQPRVPIQSITREGAAGIRVRFESNLRPAHRFSASIPSGWRALGGASFLTSQTISWMTPLPALKRLEAPVGLDLWEPSDPLFLTFNQEVDPESVKSCLRLKTVPQGEIVEVPSPLNLRAIPEKESTFEVSLPILEPRQRYKLYFDPGLRSEEGPLRGEEGDGFFFGPRPYFQFQSSTEQQVQYGEPFLMEFSEPVKLEELKRHIKGLRWEREFLTTQDNRSFELHRVTGTSKRHLTLLKSLRSIQGKRLEQDVELVFSYPEKASKLSEWREIVRTSPGATVLPDKLTKGSVVSTWRLSQEQLAELIAVPKERWNRPDKMKIELAKPVFSTTLKKDAPATRFLKSPTKEQKTQKYSAFLVRITEKGGAVNRLLVQRTDLRLETFGLNGLMNFAVKQIGSNSPLQRALVQVIDSNRQVLVAGQTNAQGQGSVSHPKLDEGRLVRVVKDQDWAVAPMRHQEVTTKQTLPGQIWCDGAVFETGAALHYFGCWWAELERPPVRLTNEVGEVIPIEAGPAEELGHLFKGRLLLPAAPGEYFLELPTEDFKTPTYRIIVTDHPVLKSHPSELTVSLDEETGRYKGEYLWDGPGANNLLVRASLRPVLGQVESWHAVDPRKPHWSLLRVEQEKDLNGGNYRVEKLPELQGPWQLVVELVDLRDTNRVFRREKISLGQGQLELAQVELKHTESDVRLARFQFEVVSSVANRGAESLRCQILLKEKAGWSPQSEGLATFRNGIYEWSGPITGSGRVRLSCVLENDLGEYRASWESVLEPDSVADWEPLELSQEVIFSSDTPLQMSWPDLPAGTPVWLRAYSGKSLLHSSYRISESGGSLGALSLTNLRPGSKEVTILASHSDGKVIRGNRVEVMSLAHFLPATIELEEEILDSYEVEPGSVVTARAEQSATPMKYALAWWEHNPQEAERVAGNGVLDALVASATHRKSTLHGNRRLAVLGPLELSDTREFSLEVPTEPGDYHLYFLSEGEDSNYYYAQVPIKITASSGWKPLIPLVFRPGDKFSAGVRFMANPDEAAPTGATTSVILDSTLLPVGYFSTAALVDPGGVGDMLFSYQAPEFIAPLQVDDFMLRWELGVEGVAETVEVQLRPIPTEIEDVKFRERTLASEEAVRLNISGLSHWRAEFNLVDADETLSAVITVGGLDQGERSLEISNEGEAVLVGHEESHLEVRHVSGPAVRLEVFEMVPSPEANQERASSIYLMRRLENVDELPIEKDELVISQEYLMSYHLVVPERSEECTLLSPVPGGLEPLGCWLKEPSGLLALDWSQSPGQVSVRLPELESGEHELLLSCQAIVDGTFHWPAGKLMDQGGTLIAKTLEQSVLILED